MTKDVKLSHLCLIVKHLDIIRLSLFTFLAVFVMLQFLYLDVHRVEGRSLYFVSIFLSLALLTGLL